MTAATHIAGPWIVEGRTVYALNSKGVNAFFASVQDAHTPEAELVATARLMGSALTMIEALQSLEDRLSNLIAAGQLQMPDSLRVQCLSEALESLHDDVTEAIAATGSAA